MSALPTGTVTFLFTDIEGSTKLVQRLGDGARATFDLHGEVMRSAIAASGGTAVRTEGDSFFVVFSSAPAAVEASIAAQRALAAAPWPGGEEVRVRMGMHSGVGALGGDDYVGLDVHRAARIAAAAHGGQIVVSAATQALADGSGGVAYLDLGEHRFKDLLQPERVFQVIADGLPTEFPALASLTAIPNNLPVELTSFITRPEVATAGGLLDAHRLLTLTGPGGTGKTRLALQIAADRADRYEGVYFVPLAPVRDASLVVTTIASTIGVRQVADDPLVGLTGYLKDRSFLLVLDNFEQVLDAAPVVADLLRAARGLAIIVTSRAGLHVSGEQEFPVPPLTVPNGKRDLDSLRATGAVALFIERATAARPEFALDAANAGAVAEITRRLDGLPLAIELAAARVRLLPPQTMLERLGGSLDLLESNRRDLPDRQRTLRGAISWSYDLLDPEESRLVRLMSVFRGGATLGAIESVCSRVSGVSSDLLTVLESLVDHSLLRPEDRGGEVRFGMLETIREFMWEQLQASEECHDVEDAHLNVYLQFAEEVAPRLTGVDQREALNRFDADRENLRAAFDHATAARAAEPAHRLAAVSWRYWHMRGLIREGRDRIQAVLAVPTDDARLLAKTYEAAGGLAYWANDMNAAADLYRTALAHAETTGDTVLIANAHYNLSFPLMLADRDHMDVSGAVGELDAAESGFAAAGHTPGLAQVAWGRSFVAINLEAFDDAVAYGLRAAEAFSEVGDLFMTAWSHHSAELGHIRLRQYGAAASLAGQVLDEFTDAGDVSGLVLTFGNIVYLAAVLGEDERAMTLWGAAKALAERTGVNLLEASLSATLGSDLDDARLRVSAADRARWEAAGSTLGTEESVALAREIVAVAESRADD